VTRIKHLKHADLLLTEGLSTYYAYWFDDNQCMCIQTDDVWNSYVLVDTRKNLIQDALDMVKEQGATIEDGNIPGYFECECGNWTADGDSERRNNVKLCLPCYDYDVRMSHYKPS
jgi:hypothetical protein